MKTIETRRAISYIRFSTPKQEHGFSLERQTENTKRFCQRHNLYLDESTTIKDLGKSAFKGANADKGNLGAFLDAVSERKIERGTVLVVEALDRISRHNVVEATHLLTDILRNGIDVGLVSEDKVYSYDYVNKNPFELIVAVTYLIRGGDESRMKSERIKDAWIRKKRSISQSKAVVKIPTPGWLEREGDKWVVVEEKAKIVRQIFSDYLNESQGIWVISQSLNNRKIPVVTHRSDKKSKWHRITIHRILTDKTAIGTYTRIEPPVEKYFPAIVSEKDFYAVQAKLKERRQFRGRHSLNDISLFKGLCKCHKCGGTMTRITRTRPTKAGPVIYRYLYCHNSILGTCLPARSVDLTKFETAFLEYASTSESAILFFAESKVDDSLKIELKNADGQITDKIMRRDRLVSAIEAGTDETPVKMMERITALENEIKVLRSKKESLTAQLNRKPNGKGAVCELVSRAQEATHQFLGRPTTGKERPDNRLKIRELMRQFIKTMVVYPQKRKAVFTTIAGKTRELNW